ncbi:Fungalysin metallopeptidase-domain-containing protein [Auriculariales sp. MPI-PUGE-AT-0066]|nr:Fungalysin metallopeptidase-domain-containing protein [Auriculariales sp. MPI-PUGE-AT-0066]
MTTPADGSPGKMCMFLWDITNPERDGALENDTVLHEYTHGITNRLTGGGTGEHLQSDEAGVMGEGWSDSIAFWMQQATDTVSDYTMGSFAATHRQPECVTIDAAPQGHKESNRWDCQVCIGRNRTDGIYEALRGFLGVDQVQQEHIQVLIFCRHGFRLGPKLFR